MATWTRCRRPAGQSAISIDPAKFDRTNEAPRSALMRAGSRAECVVSTPAPRGAAGSRGHGLPPPAENRPFRNVDDASDAFAVGRGSQKAAQLYLALPCRAVQGPNFPPLASRRPRGARPPGRGSGFEAKGMGWSPCRSGRSRRTVTPQSILLVPLPCYPTTHNFSRLHFRPWACRAVGSAALRLV